MHMKQYEIDRKKSGFTFIELMVTISIVAVLMAIAIPNYINYRDKGYCSLAENDFDSIKSGLSDYFAIPTNVSYSDYIGPGPVPFPGSTPVEIGSQNTARIIFVAGPPPSITVTITDGSGRCPAAYQSAVTGWDGAGNYTKDL